MDFYTGRILRLDLGARRASVEPLDMERAGLYLGGKGMLFRTLFDELAPGTDPLSPANPLILATGPFAGTAAAAASRLIVGCRSPLTGTVLDSYVGGSFAPELKYAGYDMVVVSGRSKEPVVVRIEDERVTFEPASPGLWGMSTSEFEETMRGRHGPQVKVLSIGRAGENLVPFACISTDQSHKAGRGGAGAVMGSKNLKGIVLRGTGAVTVGDMAAFTAEMQRLLHERIWTEDNFWAIEEGTPFLVEPVNDTGGLPTRNWQSGSFDGAGNIDSRSLLARRTKVRACAQCPVACRQVHRFADHVSEGPEYETIGLCGSNCGIADLEALAAFNRACDEEGLDTITCGSVVALAMELCETGAADYGLRFGDTDAYLEAPRLIAARSGWGAELAEGARALAAAKGRPDMASEIKGLEMPAYDPRATFGMGLAYATADRGACHMRAFPAGEELLAGTSPRHTLEGKAEAVIAQQDQTSLTWSCGWCANVLVDLDMVAAHVAFLWRDAARPDELRRLGARVWNLGRLLNVREGFDRRHDRLPHRVMHAPHPDGASAGVTIPEADLQKALDEYYRLRGWDAQGIPREETLTALGVDVRL